MNKWKNWTIPESSKAEKYFYHIELGKEQMAEWICQKWHKFSQKQSPKRKSQSIEKCEELNDKLRAGNKEQGTRKDSKPIAEEGLALRNS